MFGMLIFQAWKIDRMENENSMSTRKMIPEIYFRHVEKIMLYSAKYIIQWILLTTIKFYFIVSTKIKIWISKNLPKVNNIFKKKIDGDVSEKSSFLKKALLELKVKTKKIKEKVKKEHGENNIV